ncbi:MAG: hypothetical protein CV045_06070 [Cyanobacteria bacterium M5B4]|nr:MAG: hypothetical protein CV045_06070 [Cyanobacteria bacterium M5B4]
MAFAPVNTILDRIQAQEKWRQGRLWFLVVRYWGEAVGALVAPHTRPTGIHRQVLQVAVSSGVWAQNLTFARRSILQKLHLLMADQLTEANPIVDIHFSTARWEKVSPSPAVNKRQTKTIKELPQSPQEAIDRCMTSLQQKKWQYRCPQCGAPASALEIDRWQMCRYCASRHLLSQK